MPSECHVAKCHWKKQKCPEVRNSGVTWSSVHQVRSKCLVKERLIESPWKLDAT